MNALLGFAGVAGFLAYEVSFALAKIRSGSKIWLKTLGNWKYWIIILLFSVLVFFITCIFALPDTNTSVLSIGFADTGSMSLIRAFVVGLASVHIYKTSETVNIPGAPLGPRTQTSPGGTKPLTFKSLHLIWRRDRWTI
jgi:hypothetical protein